MNVTTFSFVGSIPAIPPTQKELKNIKQGERETYVRNKRENC